MSCLTTVLLLSRGYSLVDYFPYYFFYKKLDFYHFRPFDWRIPGKISADEMTITGVAQFIPSTDLEKNV